MALRDFKVLTFDVVGTLIDFEGGMLAYLRQAVPGSDVTDEQFLAAYRAARKSPDTDWYPNDLVRCWHVVAPQLGLPDSFIGRHPFPGPGLGVRILGEVKKEYADLLRRADAIFIEELRSTIEPHSGKTWYELTSQAFTVFLPVKSVGVMGDGRTYDYVVALRAVQTSDFMTADWAELPYALLKKVSSRIINEVRGINRVTYDVSSKPPATIEWE